MEQLVKEHPQLTAAELLNLCRSCLKPHNLEPGDTSPLSLETYPRGMPTLNIMLMETTRLRVPPDKLMPTHLCASCAALLYSSFTFQKMCIESHEKIIVLTNQLDPICETLTPTLPKAETDLDMSWTVQKNVQLLPIVLQNQSIQTQLSGDMCNVCKNDSEPLDKIIGCINCNETFIDQIHYAKHMLDVHDVIRNTNSESTYTCLECNSIFDDFKTYNDHIVVCKWSQSKPETINVSHDESMSVTETSKNDFSDMEDSYVENTNDLCESENINVTQKTECSDKKVIINTEDLSDEKKTKSSPNCDNAYCDICKRQFPSNAIFKQHSVTHTREIPIYRCDICGKEFTRNTHKKRHLIIHQTVKNFNCHYCKKKFCRKDNLQRHILLHTTAKSFDCDSCDEKFLTEFKLANHMVVHGAKRKYTKSFRCNVCNRSYALEKSLKVHMRVHNGETTIKCEKCPAEFHTKWQMKDHTFKCHNAEKRFLCSECGKKFYRIDYFKIHMRRHKGETPYKCSFCNKGFSRTTDLRAHEKYHTGDKKNICNVCGLGFTRPYALKVHLRVHSGEKPYTCKECGKKFSQSYDLKLHTRRHTGERLKCDSCDEEFIREYLLRQHKKKVHGVVTESRIARLNKIKDNEDPTVKQELSSQD